LSASPQNDPTEKLIVETDSQPEACLTTSRQAIVLTVDRFGAGYLGPYGNTWIETPALNRLAAQSVLFERFLIDAPEPAAFLSAVLTGRSAAQKTADASPPALQEANSLTMQLAAQSRPSLLITDDQELAQHAVSDAFDEVILIDLSTAAVSSEESLEQTALARFFAAAISSVDQASAEALIWVHARGMAHDWDAPQEMRNAFADEGDPDPPEFVTAPNQWMDEDFDPDVLTGLTFAYAAQVVLLDICLAAFCDAWTHRPVEHQPLFIFAGTRGFPLGEHQAIGSASDRLFSELVQVPLLVRFPGGSGALSRMQAIAQPAELFPWLRAWFSEDEATSDCERGLLQQLIDRDRRADDAFAIINGKKENALQTAAWFLRVPQDQPVELYAKPDDRWESNEVQNRCREIAAELEEFLQRAIVTDDR
jgi:hypothetical protein